MGKFLAGPDGPSTPTAQGSVFVFHHSQVTDSPMGKFLAGADGPSTLTAQGPVVGPPKIIWTKPNRSTTGYVYPREKRRRLVP